MSGNTRKLDIDQEQPTEPVAEPKVEAQVTGKIVFHVTGSGEVFAVPRRSSIIIGRHDPSNRIQPDIDLAPYRGFQYGVSRHHAIITERDGMLYIRGLSNTNGTFVNGVSLESGVECPLRDKDELLLGALRLQVSLVGAAAASGT